jgi:hypothetical protein
MQMAQNIRRYKGVRPIPEVQGLQPITIDGSFADWAQAAVEYRDTVGDTFHRAYKGYGGLQYTNDSGRNDIVTSKVAVDERNVFFYVEANDALTPHPGSNWMLLLIDADGDPDTGWYGYDFLVNQRVVNERQTTIMRYAPDTPGGPWVEAARLNYAYAGKALELAVPRQLLGLEGNAFTFDFHWSDNPADLDDPISLCVNGDSAPNRRFNYRCVWKR